MSGDVVVKIEHVSKQYRLGEIGGTTLYETFQRLRAKLFHKEDPTKKIGAKNYNKGEKFLALDDINLEIKKGERVGIIGHNGAGKSTLLKLLCRVTAPTSGTIGLNGRIASMLEVGTGFHPELTGRENVYMNGAILGMTKKEIDAKMEDIIEFSEVREFIDTPVKRYSSGMYVKLAFAVAAHLDSEIMIMDEVLAVGDAFFQKKCLDKMFTVSVNEGKTILFVSHNMSTISQLCNRTIVLEHGAVVFDGPSEEGITYYLGGNIKSDASIHYLTNYEDISSSHLVTFESLHFMSDTTSFTQNSKVDIQLCFRIVSPRDGLRIRFTIQNRLGSPIFTVSSMSFSLKDLSSRSKKFSLPTDCLAPGRYRLRLVLYEENGFGGQIRHDCIENAAIFNIVEDETLCKMVWDSKFWGEISFPELKVEDEQ